MSQNSVWHQTEIVLPAMPRGCHRITDLIIKNVPELSKFKIGIAHIHLKATSAGLTLNENADPDVLHDMNAFLDDMVPETRPFKHIEEGSDDMPAHVKTSLLGSSLSLPITNGRLNLGTWQGLWLCEYRNHPNLRKVIVTLNGTQ